MKAIIAQRLIPTVSGQGRRAAVEIMINTPLLSDLILKGEVHEIKELMKKSNELGMKTFDQALFELYRDNLITQEDALRNADSPNEVRLMIKLSKKGGNEELSSALDGLTLEDTDDGSSGMMR
jgi:twitching motility protein PilU